MYTLIKIVFSPLLRLKDLIYYIIKVTYSRRCLIGLSASENTLFLELFKLVVFLLIVVCAQAIVVFDFFNSI